MGGLPGGGASPAALAAGVPAVGVKMAVDGDGRSWRSNNVFEGTGAQPGRDREGIADAGFHTGDGGHEEGAYS